MILAVSLVTPRRNTNSSSASGWARPIFSLRIGCREIDLVAAVVAEFERGRLDLEALRALNEAPPIGAAAEFAVGNDLQADLLLQRDYIADALVLQLGKFRIVHLLGRMLAEGLAQRRWPQQAADMVGAKGWTALGRHADS